MGAFRKRQFLNPITSDANSFIAVVADSSDDGMYTVGNYILTLADCKRIVEIEFPLGNVQLQKQSWKKLNLIVETLTEFQDALKKELELIQKAAAKKA